MSILRTPDERFTDLPDFDYSPRYAEIDGGSLGQLRIACVDEGTRDADVVLCMHGEPSWSYLYRFMIPVFVDAGYRCVAPDLVGFGRSDKPAERDSYTYANHVSWMQAWLNAMDLQRVTLVCQDWGGLIGLRLVAAMPDRFDRVSAANTFLPTGHGEAPEAFLQWREFSQNVPEFPTSMILQRASTRELSPAELAAYDAPFPDESYKAGARQFPMLVPISLDDPESAANIEAWSVLSTWDKPFLTCFSDQDPITRGADRALQERIPGTRDQPHVTLEGGGHFLQEDVGRQWADTVVEWMG